MSLPNIPTIFGLSQMASAMIYLGAFVAVCVLSFILYVSVSKRRAEVNESRSIAWNRKERKKKGIEEAARKHDGEDADEAEAEPIDTGLNVAEEAEENKAAFVLGGNLGMSARKKEEDETPSPEVINGYLQKSNTAPIRPVYSNTPSARAAQKKDLESEEEELAAKYEPPKKVKPTALKRPTAAKNSFTDDPKPEDEAADIKEDEDSPYESIVRPVIGSEVSNAEIDRPAEVSEVAPKIAMTGLAAANEAATAPVKGFAAPKKEPVKRPKSAFVPSAETAEDALEEADRKAEALERIEERKKARLEKASEEADG
ncbi:MAG: hypothetical protein J6X33_07660 [Clostridiales bacterium]|nr:hypothetical protein [Clostridiales bacterium]